MGVAVLLDNLLTLGALPGAGPSCKRPPIQKPSEPPPACGGGQSPGGSPSPRLPAAPVESLLLSWLPGPPASDSPTTKMILVFFSFSGGQKRGAEFRDSLDKDLKPPLRLPAGAGGPHSGRPSSGSCRSNQRQAESSSAVRAERLFQAKAWGRQTRPRRRTTLRGLGCQPSQTLPQQGVGGRWAAAGHLWPLSLPWCGGFPSSRPPWSRSPASPTLPLPAPGACPSPAFPGQYKSTELATTTYVALETVAREKGCGGHGEPSPREGGELLLQPRPCPPSELSKTTASPRKGN